MKHYFSQNTGNTSFAKGFIWSRIFYFAYLKYNLDGSISRLSIACKDHLQKIQVQNRTYLLDKVINSIEHVLFNENKKIYQAFDVSNDVFPIALDFDIVRNNKPSHDLNASEILVFKAIYNGIYNPREISVITHRSTRTVESIIKQLCIKFECDNKYALVAKIGQSHHYMRYFLRHC